MVGFFRQLRQRLWGKTPPAQRPLPPLAPEPEETPVPEWTIADLQQALASAPAPLLLDVREPYEWRQVHIPAAIHIPMNDIPQHLAELPHNQPIVVFCAHGSRSYDVAGYLIEQGYTAYSLAGGISHLVRAGVDFRAHTPEQ
ncbi:MAG: rhodanese-like domain-containing protein [Caldilineaceae bacterium]|nr:rhodanese-like domain-containing protein [Caldilineaceae bacterium]